MKVIKHGNTVKEFTCPDCGCIFLAGESYIYMFQHQDEYWDDGVINRTGTSTFQLSIITYVDQFVSCPECGAKCRKEAQNDGQT